MNVWLITIGEALPLSGRIRKSRTLILAEKLVERGHSVTWWASAFDHFKKAWVCRKDTDLTLPNGVKVILIKGTGYKKNVSISRLIDHRIIASKFKTQCRKTMQPDLIVASMPSYDLAYEAVRYARARGIPVVVDVRDQWPDIFLDHMPPAFRRAARLLLAHEYAIFKSLMRSADAITSMMDSLLQWGIDYAQRERNWRDRVFYLGQQQTTENRQCSPRMEALLAQLNGKFVVTFVGTFASYHNPSILIEAARKLNNCDEIRFVIAGSGELLQAIRENAKGLENVILPGWLEQDDISSLLDRSHIGVCTTTKHAPFLPNKFFSYLSAGLPVVSAFDGDIREIIRERRIGFNYEPNDLETLIEAILGLYNNKALHEKMSRNAQSAFRAIGDADNIYDEYAAHLEKIVTTRIK
jgi:glycosyltransferase involved in cell wall biosynthesis